MCSNENYVGPPSEKNHMFQLCLTKKSQQSQILSDDLPYAYYTTHCAIFLIPLEKGVSDFLIF